MKITKICHVVLMVIFAFTLTVCATLAGESPARVTEHQDWEALLAESFPDGHLLSLERFRSRWGAVVDGDLVTFDGTNYHDFIYVFPPDVTLSDYEALVLVMEIFDIHKPAGSNSPTRNVTFSFRKGPTEVPPADDNFEARRLKQFWAANEADFFPFQENGIFVVGLAGEQWARLINDPAHRYGFNVQNSIWGVQGSHLNRTGYTMRMHALMLIPNHDPSDFGSRGNEFILNPSAFSRSGAWGGNDATGNILMMNNNGSVVYRFPGGVNVSNFNTLVVEYRVLDNSGGDMTLNFWANSHEGHMLGTHVLSSDSGTLRVPLTGVTTGFAVRNNLRRSANSVNYVIKIESLRLVNQ